MEKKLNLKQRLVSPVLMWLIVFIGIIIFIKLVPNIKLFNIGFFGYFIFIITLIYWIYFFMSAVFVHKKAVLSVSGIDKLVDTGIYSIIRHPIYSSDIFLGIGIFFIFQTLNVLISIIWLSIILFFWMKLEEKTLTKKFGNEYIEYKKKVPMLIPNFFKK